MKVLYINQSVGLGSTGKIITNIANNLEGDNEFKCIHGYFPNAEAGEALFPGESISTISKSGYYRYNVKAKLFGKTGFYGKKATQNALSKLGNWIPDIVHIHNLHGYFIHIPTLFEYLEKINKPIIYTLHDCFAVTGLCTHFISSNCDKWKTHCDKPCPERKEYPFAYLSCPVKKNFDKKKTLYAKVKDNLTFVAPSEWLANIVKESPITERPALVIHNGIDFDSFHETDKKFRREHHLENKIVILGIAMPWSWKKGLDEFIKLANDLPDRYQIVMIGIDESIKKTLPSNVICVPRTDSIETLADIYSSSDLFVLPTYGDSYPTVSLESQACGTPVLAYDTGGTKETLLPKYSSCVAKGDYSSLLKSIIDFFPKRIPKEDVQLFSCKWMIEEYSTLYRSLYKI